MFNFLKTGKQREEAEYKRQIKNIMREGDYRGDDADYPKWFSEMVFGKLEGYSFQKSFEDTILLNFLYSTLNKMINLKNRDHDDPKIDEALNHLLKPVKNLMKKDKNHPAHKLGKKDNSNLNVSDVVPLLDMDGGKNKRTRKINRRRGTRRR